MDALTGGVFGFCLVLFFGLWFFVVVLLLLLLFFVCLFLFFLFFVCFFPSILCTIFVWIHFFSLSLCLCLSLSLSLSFFLPYWVFPPLLSPWKWVKLFLSSPWSQMVRPIRLKKITSMESFSRLQGRSSIRTLPKYTLYEPTCQKMNLNCLFTNTKCTLFLQNKTQHCHTTLYTPTKQKSSRTYKKSASWSNKLKSKLYV